MKDCREHAVTPHCAQIEGWRSRGSTDGRTTQSGGYQASLIVRRRIEKIFDWAKSIGGLRQRAHRGMKRVNAACQYVGAACNLLRLAMNSSSEPPASAGP